MTLTELKALMADATPGPWSVQLFKGETECGHPVECDWEAVADPLHNVIDLYDQHSNDTKLSIAAVNALPALIAAVEALKEFVRLDDDALGLMINHPDYGGELVSALHDARAALKKLGE